MPKVIQKNKNKEKILQELSFNECEETKLSPLTELLNGKRRSKRKRLFEVLTKQSPPSKALKVTKKHQMDPNHKIDHDLSFEINEKENKLKRSSDSTKSSSSKIEVHRAPLGKKNVNLMSK